MWKGVLAGHRSYADTMSDLLRKEHGDSHRAVKQLMRLTGASERTVKHRLAGHVSKNDPDGEELNRRQRWFIQRLEGEGGAVKQ
jgi:hypothetical protein